MKHIELEELLWKYNFEDGEFLEYLQKNPISEITFVIEDDEVQKETGKFTVIEESVLEYIEECCSYDVSPLSEERERKLASEMKKILYYAFFYLKDGISYMDLVQEGVVGLLKGIDFQSECLEAWAVRAMFLKVQSEIQDLKFGFKNFLKTKREEAEHTHHSHHHSEEEKHECSCGHKHDEDHECCGKHHHHETIEEEFLHEGEIDRNKVLEKLLQSNVAIDEMEKIIEERMDFRNMKYRLYPIEIEVLNYYFGLLVEKRHSIFEIEEKFHLKKDHAQNIFENAMYKLSSVKGKLEL